ncbi:heme exporter protein CcmD [Yoonia vestfoldensis]|jgi:heme exporter protein D|uniref:Heme exporter protein D n=1 Tax=Yoonia vestfoldensis TaxID=245188 RepID=A0A1Y0EC37_9RHOB|nr:heme exporter protein CcmD [Yoonia vestfoldensis]ARU01058.1 heme exporter protein D (CcmD) [Yoonia vestfoldensis]
MPDLGSYAVEVTAAYLGSIVLLLAIVGVSWRRYARMRAALDEVEKNG